MMTLAMTGVSMLPASSTKLVPTSNTIARPHHLRVGEVAIKPVANEMHLSDQALSKASAIRPLGDENFPGPFGQRSLLSAQTL